MSSQQYLDNMYKLGAMGMSLMNQNRQNAAYQEAQEDKKQYKTAMGLVTAPMSTSALAQANQNITEGDYKGLGSPWNTDLRKSAMNYIPAGEDAVKQEVANALGIQPAFVKAQTDYANSQSAIGNAKKLNMELKEKENQQFVSDFAGKIASAYLNGQKDPTKIEGFSDLSGLHQVQVQAAASKLVLENENGRKDVEKAWAEKSANEVKKTMQGIDAVEWLYSNKNESADESLIKLVDEMKLPYTAKKIESGEHKGKFGLYYNYDFDGNGEIDDLVGYYSKDDALGFLRSKTEADYFRESFARKQMRSEENVKLAQLVRTASKDGQDVQYIMQLGDNWNPEYIVIGDKGYTQFKDMKSMIEAGYKLPDNAHQKEKLANQKTQAEINLINANTEHVKTKPTVAKDGSPSQKDILKAVQDFSLEFQKTNGALPTQEQVQQYLGLLSVSMGGGVTENDLESRFEPPNDGKPNPAANRLEPNPDDVLGEVKTNAAQPKPNTMRFEADLNSPFTPATISELLKKLRDATDGNPETVEKLRQFMQDKGY